LAKSHNRMGIRAVECRSYACEIFYW
jgi:hypothetical protein